MNIINCKPLIEGTNTNQHESRKRNKYLQKGGTPLQPGTFNPIDSATDNCNNNSKIPVDMDDNNQVGYTRPSTVTIPEKKKNIDNLGIFQNAYGGLYPRCLRPNVIHRKKSQYINHKKRQQQ